MTSKYCQIFGVVALAVVFAGCGSTKTVTVPVPQAPKPGTATSVPHEAGATRGQCGVERWAVKTLQDPAASAVNPKPVATTVEALIAKRAPVGPTDRVPGVETTVWTLKAKALAFKQEGDSDIHLAIASLTDSSKTMIVEFPAGYCDQLSAVRSQISRARAAFVARFGLASNRYRKASGTVTVTGTGFFDRIHGQRGVARNGVELHPVLSFR